MKKNGNVYVRTEAQCANDAGYQRKCRDNDVPNPREARGRL